MKQIKTILFVLLVAALIFVTACTTGQASSPPPRGPIGGGCGVGAPADAVAEVVSGTDSAGASGAL